MSTITTILGTDVISTSRTTINTNFDNLNADKIETSVLDTDTALTANSDAKIPSQKAVKAYADAQGNVNASETTKGIVEEATDAEVTARTAIGATGAKLFVTPAKLSSILKFGGTGADGALTLTSGATNIDLGSAQIVIKNYTSISITGTGSLTFTNPHANGTTIVLKSQGAVTLTSSTAPMITLVGIGAAAITSGYGATIIKTNVANAGSAGIAGAPAATASLNPNNLIANQISGKYPFLVPGAGGRDGGATEGGGGGGSAISGGNSGNNGLNTGSSGSGVGGRGGGVLVIECGGALNFTTASGISVAGAAGGNGTGGGHAGGGGGGGGGICIITYNTLIAASGTIVSTGGAGGSREGSGGVGGAGGNGYSLIAANTEFS